MLEFTKYKTTQHSTLEKQNGSVYLLKIIANSVVLGIKLWTPQVTIQTLSHTLIP